MANVRILILAVLVLSCARFANSCSCFFDPLSNLVCDEFTLVFTGTGLESVPEAMQSPPLPGDFFFPSFINDLVTVRVDSIIKDDLGVLPPVGGNITVKTSFAGTSCQTFLPLGIEYFLLLDGSNPTINPCAKNAPVSSGNLPIIVDKCCPEENKGTGDVDGNGSLNISDIVIIAEFVTNGTGPLSQVSCAFDIGDSNGDSIVDVLDVVNFIECLLSGGVC